MNLQRLRWGEWIAVVAALDLVVTVFRAWYKVSETGARVTAWDALTSGRYLLLATAAVGILLFVLTAAEQTAQMTVQPGYIAGLVGLACTVYVAYRLATPPADNLDAAAGLYFGLASAVGVALGGLLAAREPVPATHIDEPGPAASQWGATTSTDTGFQEPVADSGAGWTPAPPAAAPAPGVSPGAVVPPATVAGGL
ncbi:MAG: hypothetical protein ACJ756_02110, partial [Solirubrobacterales bacterium]